MANNKRRTDIHRKILPLSERTGKLPYTLKNDYLFKIVLQSNEDVLHALLCSLLHLHPEEIYSIEITNSIAPGTAMDDKSVILDIRLILNNNQMINLEMQVINYHDWPERSLLYLCRAFDNLKKGQPYKNIMPAHHIGILDFPLEHLSRQFHSTFYMMNLKNHEIYSDKFCLSVLDLSHIQLATEEDKAYGLDKWAALFKATTWEEIKMLAADNSIYQTVADSIYTLTEDENIREQCRRREELLAVDEWMKDMLKEKIEMVQELNSTIQEQKSTMQEQDCTIQEQGHTIQEQGHIIQKQDCTIQKQGCTIQEQSATIASQKARIAELEKALEKFGQ